MVVIGQSCFIPAKWLYSGKLVLFGQSVCIRAKALSYRQKWFYSGICGFIRAMGFYSGKVVVFGQK